MSVQPATPPQVPSRPSRPVLIYVKRHAVPIIGAAVVVGGQAAKWFQFGTTIIDWVSRAEFVRDHLPGLLNLLKVAISPQGSNVVSVAGLVLFFVSFFVLHYRKEAVRASALPPIVESESIETVKVARPAEPNLVASEPDVVWAHTATDGTIIEGVQTGTGVKFLKAYIVPYRNRVIEGRQIGVARYISARVLFQCYDNKTRLEADRTAWLSEEISHVFFNPNDTRQLIIAIADIENNVYVVQRDIPGTRRGRETKHRSIADGLYSVQVSLLDETDSQVKNKSEFILDIAHEPVFDITLQEANLWRALKLAAFHERISLLVGSYQAVTSAAEHVDAKENLEALTNRLDRLILDCKIFAAQQFNSDKAKRLGLSLSEYDDQPPFYKQMAGNPSASARVSQFLDRLSDLRANG